MVTEPIEAPVESFAEMVPVTEIFPGSGDLAGIVNVVTLASDATAIGHDGIANEIVCLMIGIVIVQFAPQSGHEAASGMMPSSCVCVVERGRVSVCVGGGEGGGGGGGGGGEEDTCADGVASNRAQTCRRCDGHERTGARRTHLEVEIERAPRNRLGQRDGVVRGVVFSPC